MPVDCFHRARCIPGIRDATAAKNVVNESFGIQIEILDLTGWPADRSRSGPSGPAGTGAPAGRPRVVEEIFRQSLVQTTQLTGIL